MTLTKSLSGNLTIDRERAGCHWIKEDDIGQVVLVGGGAQLFSIYRTLEKRFAGKDLFWLTTRTRVWSWAAAWSMARQRRKRVPVCCLCRHDAPEPEEPVSGAEESKEFLLEASNGDVVILLPGENKLGRSAR